MRCIICKKDSNPNLMVLKSNICHECEQTLLKLRVDDRTYELYKDTIKRALAPAFSPSPKGA